MKITILGAGIGASSYLPDKNVNKYPPAFLIQWGKSNKLLFDCSVGVYWRLEQAGIDYASIHHVAISHSHPDHCAPIHYLQAVFLKGYIGGEKFKNNSLSFYGPDFLMQNFQTLFDIYTPNNEGKPFDYPKLSLLSMSSSNAACQIFDATLKAQKVHHGFGKCDAVSYRLETPEGIIAYSGDTGDCEGIRKIAANADIFICEASARIGDFESPKKYGHLNPFSAGKIAKESNVKKLVLFHYSGLDKDEAIIQEVKNSGFSEEVVCGKDSGVVVM